MEILKGGALIPIHMSPQNWNFHFGSLGPNYMIGSLPLLQLAHSIIRSEDTLIRQLVTHMNLLRRSISQFIHVMYFHTCVEHKIKC